MESGFQKIMLLLTSGNKFKIRVCARTILLLKVKTEVGFDIVRKSSKGTEASQNPNIGNIDGERDKEEEEAGGHNSTGASTQSETSQGITINYHNSTHHYITTNIITSNDSSHTIGTLHSRTSHITYQSSKGTGTGHECSNGERQGH
ncbi:hypothetical protein VMCG_03832 [Cytospora schulzeri]|uniref:Uncharacterized protein n=1 Tax=Cytospora schulzeri TaxID=448051 RepID=A0A423WVF6_9PEZI|nr:hypothetical protein VMCG_03832 [Valsa malicola]